MKVISVFKAVTKNWIRSRSGLFFSILFPILLLVVFGSIFGGIGGGSSSYALYIQNLDVDDQGQESQVSLAFLTARYTCSVFLIFSFAEVEANFLLNTFFLL